jgi:uncharacterized Tic20 family protein
MDTNELIGNDSLPTIVPTSDEKTMALLSHILTIVAWFIAPLIIYLLRKDESTFVAEHAKESLNFQITMLVFYVISGILVLLLIGLLFIWILSIVNLILVVVATIKAGEGKLYRYPINFRIIK